MSCGCGMEINLGDLGVTEDPKERVLKAARAWAKSVSNPYRDGHAAYLLFVYILGDALQELEEDAYARGVSDANLPED